jgi:hypothetical protein
LAFRFWQPEDLLSLQTIGAKMKRHVHENRGSLNRAALCPSVIGFTKLDRLSLRNRLNGFFR